MNVGPLRARLLARLEPLARDLVIAGADRNEVGVLIFPNVEACRALTPGLPTDAADGDVIDHPSVRAELRSRLAALAKLATGSSNRVTRASPSAVTRSGSSNEV